MEGQLAEHPLAELIREITNTELSGALRVSRGRAKIAIYFDAGKVILASSNLRAHRLREVLKRNGISEAELKSFSETMSDDDLVKSLRNSGKFTSNVLPEARANQTYDVLRAVLLWTDGEWQFDERVRPADDARVEVNVSRLLLECARHLPFAFVKTRLSQTTAEYSLAARIGSMNLLPTEAAILSRAANAGSNVALTELVTNGISREESLRAIYALSLSGLLERSDWQLALDQNPGNRHPGTAGSKQVKEKTEPDGADIDLLFARLSTAKDHYDVLGISRAADTEEIKDAYHKLALQYHPDRFHQSALRGQVESAFARIAQAYETLGDANQRRNYDGKRAPGPAAKTKKPETQETPVEATQTSPAEVSFRNGMSAMAHQQYDNAIRFLAEAAMLEPREARYRANYGYALMHRPKMRRAAETELQAALALQPGDASFRVMLAELYQSLGLRRRAQAEAARALAIDPKNEAARALMASLKS